MLPRVTRWIAAGAISSSLLLTAGWPVAARCRSADPEGPRTIVIALDCVPLRVINQARERGAFAGWPEAIPMVAPFPSLTNVSFTAMLKPFDVASAPGYEVQHYDRELNEVVGGRPASYHSETYAWRELFDVTGKTFGGKLAGYVSPRKKLWKEMEEGRAALWELPRDLILVHGETADALAHLRGDPALLEFVIKLDDWLVQLEHEHRETFGRPLRILLLSDHGLTATKIRRLSGVHKTLREAGLHVVDHLVGRDDVIAATFGLVGYGALYLRPDRAELAATAIAGDDGVDLAAWISGAGEVSVVSSRGKATIEWQGEPGQRRLTYRPVSGDPLAMRQALDRLHARGLLDGAGFASEGDWFTQTARAAYPDALRRLIDSLTGTYVTNPATVVFSIREGYAWGWRSGHISSRLSGGRIEGTHGGLDRESTLGFYMSNDPAVRPAGVAVTSEEALARFAEYRDCLAPNVPEDFASDVEPDGAHQGKGVAPLDDSRP